MKLPGRIYHSGERTFLAIYNYFPDVHVATPVSLQGNAQRLAHVAYSEGGKRRGIDVFALQEDPGELTRTRKSFRGRTRVVYVTPKVPEIEFAHTHTSSSQKEDVDEMYDIEYDLAPIPEGLENALFDSIRSDVRAYCKAPAKTHLDNERVRRHNEIIPRTSVRYVNTDSLVVPGKKEFVPGCKLEGNCDPGKGCIAGFVPLSSKVSFDGKTFTGFYLFPHAECSYCYAAPKHKTFPKTGFRFDEKQLVEELNGKVRLRTGSEEEHGRPVKVLRLGKRTEFGSDYTLPQLSLVLEACIKTGTRTVFPTKFLRFNPEIAELLKRSNSTLLYSIGYDNEEPGPKAHGCDNAFRLEQMVKYAEVGVNSNMYLLVSNIFEPPTSRELEMIEFAQKHPQVRGIQILPARYSGKNLCERMTGHKWDDLAHGSPTQLTLEGEPVPFHGGSIVHSGTLIPQQINPGWLGLIKDNNGYVRMCHHTEGREGKTWCGTCALGKGFIMPTISVARASVKKKPQPRPKDPSQLEMDFTKEEQ